MKKSITFLFLIFIFITCTTGQKSNLKEAAITKFKNEHYNDAIALLESAVIETPKDAEIHYLLGWYKHYLAYDSRPLKGYDFAHSETIFAHLDKALELNPNYGDAKYFYGAECSANAFNSMQNYNLAQLKYFYKLAFDKGAYPKWLIELGMNMLNSCDKNSILFVGGNTDFDICSYLQLHQNCRTDITVIPIGNIDRPWYVEFLKNGLKGGVKPVTLSLTKNQIYDIHPYKWDTTMVKIKVPKNDLLKFDLSPNYHLEWLVNPDLSSQRQHSKMQGEKAKNRTYLSPQRAILLQIIEENYNQRPIYFSNFSIPFFFGGLEKFFINCGLISKLTPIDTKTSNIQYDYQAIEQLLTKHNLQHYSDVSTHNIPRISRITFTYHRSLYLLATNYANTNNREKLNHLIQLYSSHLKVGLNETTELYYLQELEKLKAQLN